MEKRVKEDFEGRREREGREEEESEREEEVVGKMQNEKERKR